MNVGDLVLVVYGAGTQIVRIRDIKKSGKLVAERFLPSPYGPQNDRWTFSTNPIDANKVIGPVPANDPRLPRAKACEKVSSAR